MQKDIPEGSQQLLQVQLITGCSFAAAEVLRDDGSLRNCCTDPDILLSAANRCIPFHLFSEAVAEEAEEAVRFSGDCGFSYHQVFSP